MRFGSRLREVGFIDGCQYKSPRTAAVGVWGSPSSPALLVGTLPRSSSWGFFYSVVQPGYVSGESTKCGVQSDLSR